MTNSNKISSIFSSIHQPLLPKNLSIPTIAYIIRELGTAHHVAVSDFIGTISLHVIHDDSEGNSLVLLDDDWPTIPVPSISIDAYLFQNNINKVDIIKTDYKGLEYKDQNTMY